MKSILLSITLLAFLKSHLRNSYIVCQTFVEHVYSNSMDLFICLTASVGQLKSNCKHALQPYLVLCLSPNNICIILIRLWENCRIKLSFELIAEPPGNFVLHKSLHVSESGILYCNLFEFGCCWLFSGEWAATSSDINRRCK